MVERTIKRSTLKGVRDQLNETVMHWPLIKPSVGADERIDFPDSYQLIVYKSFEVNGTIDLGSESRLVIL